jgi:hypothetical protein
MTSSTSDKPITQTEDGASAPSSARARDVHQFAPAVRGYLERHAVDPDLAHALGVRSDRDDILYRYETPAGTFDRRRKLDTWITTQPKGEALMLWWPAGRPDPGAEVVLCEGEPDALAALSALNGDRIAVCATPGTTIPVERVTAELAGARAVYLALDGDDPGKKAADRFARALQQFTTLKLIELGDGEDLASRLYREDDREGWLREAIANAKPVAKLALKAESGGYRRKGRRSYSRPPRSRDRPGRHRPRRAARGR